MADFAHYTTSHPDFQTFLRPWYKENLLLIMQWYVFIFIYECPLSISFHLQDVAQIQLGLSRPSGKSHLDLLNAMATRLTDSNHYREFLRKERRKMIWIKSFKWNDLKLCHLEESVKWLSCLVTTILNMNYLIIVFHWLIKKKDLSHSHLMPLGII